MRDDLRTGRMQPGISIGMIKMPMRVYDMCDGSGTQLFKSPGKARSRDSNTSVNEHLAVCPRENRNVPSRTFKHADIVTQLVGNDR